MRREAAVETASGEWIRVRPVDAEAVRMPADERLVASRTLEQGKENSSADNRSGAKESDESEWNA